MFSLFRRYRGKLLAAIALAVLLVGLARAERPSRWVHQWVWSGLGVPSLRFPGLPPGEEFRQVARALENSTNRFHGRQQLAELKAQIDSAGTDLAQRCLLKADLAQQWLRLGDLDRAQSVIAEALAATEREPALRAIRPELVRTRGLIFLRLAEQQNCLGAHCAESCIFPLAGRAQHQHRQAAQAARRDYLEYLEYNPPDRSTTGWVLAILAMALADYPDGVPEEFRFPASYLASDSPQPRFPDVAAEVGVNRLGIAGGVLADDFDGDGRIDLIASSADPQDRLRYYHNQGDGRFAEQAARRGLADQLGGLHLLSADYDNDGDADLLVLRGGWFLREGRIRKSLLRNDGRGHFSDVTEAAGLADDAFPTQAAVWGDFDNDGHLDLYVANESLIEKGSWLDFPAQLYHNNGDGTFTDQAAEAGVANNRYAKGVATGDYDNDGDLDLFVSNYHYFDDPSYGRNRFYRNLGDGRFVDVAEELGLTEPLRSFATWFFDYDNDGWLDLWVSSYSATLPDVIVDAHGKSAPPGTSPRLYRNQGDGTFADVTKPLGLDHAWATMGAGFGDLDNDGWLDVYQGTGGQFYDWLVPNVMLRNDRGQAFRNVTVAGGFGHLQKGHGIAFADWDNDGDQDVYASLGGFYSGDRFTNSLFQNPGTKGHYLYLSLEGTKANRSAVGARVTVTCSTPTGSRQIHRAAGLVSSFGALPRRLEIGLGDAVKVDRLSVVWPGERTAQHWSDVALDGWYLLRQDQAQPSSQVLEPIQGPVIAPERLTVESPPGESGRGPGEAG